MSPNPIPRVIDLRKLAGVRASYNVTMFLKLNHPHLQEFPVSVGLAEVKIGSTRTVYSGLQINWENPLVSSCSNFSSGWITFLRKYVQSNSRNNNVQSHLTKKCKLRSNKYKSEHFLKKCIFRTFIVFSS